jgi:hypothetical protein
MVSSGSKIGQSRLFFWFKIGTRHVFYFITGKAVYSSGSKLETSKELL